MFGSAYKYGERLAAEDCVSVYRITADTVLNELETIEIRRAGSLVRSTQLHVPTSPSKLVRFAYEDIKLHRRAVW